MLKGKKAQSEKIRQAHPKKNNRHPPSRNHAPPVDHPPHNIASGTAAAAVE